MMGEGGLVLGLGFRFGFRSGCEGGWIRRLAGYLRTSTGLAQSRLWGELYQRKLVISHVGITSHSGSGVMDWRGGRCGVHEAVLRRRRRRRRRLWVYMVGCGCGCMFGTQLMDAVLVDSM